MARDPRTSKQSQTMPKADAPPVSRKTSPAKLKRLKRATELQIDEFMKRVGYTNPSERTDDHGWRWFEFGSVKGRAGVVKSDSDGELYLRAESLVMELPSEQEMIPPLMRELLEANMTIAGSARLGISGEGVFVCASILADELGAGDVPAHIHAVMAIAGSFDHSFSEELNYVGANQQDIPLEQVPDPSPQAA
jgi:hypothetical protein